MAERLSFVLSMLCAAAVIAAGLLSRWEFPATAIGALAAMLAASVIGRVLGMLAESQVAKPHPDTKAQA